MELKQGYSHIVGAIVQELVILHNCIIFDTF